MTTLSATLRENRNAIKRELDQILERAQSRGAQNLTPAETTQFDTGMATVREMDGRIAELEESEADQARANEVRRMAGAGDDTRVGGFRVTREAATYRPDGQHSYFRDLVASRNGDYDAAQRLQRNQAEVTTEKRALGNSGAAGGSGGEWAPPLWLESDWVALARAGRVTADRLNRQQLPSGVSTVNIPKVTGGTSVAVQSTQNTAVSQTDATTGALSAGIVTLAGKQVVSLQLLQQSAVAFDRVILSDLASEYSRQLDLQVLNGSGASGQLLGILNVSGIQQIAYTQATPAVTGTGGFYATLNKAISAVATTRFLPPTCIVMHPRRWSWVAASFDGQNRPLVAPSGNAFNQIADAGAVAAQGPVGQMAGLPVYTDPNLPVNLGAGTNQDPVLVMRAEDLYLWETDVTLASFDAPYADSMGVLLRAHGFSSAIFGRYPASVAVVNGTGTVTPSY